MCAKKQTLRAWRALREKFSVVIAHPVIGYNNLVRRRRGRREPAANGLQNQSHVILKDFPLRSFATSAPRYEKK